MRKTYKIIPDPENEKCEECCFYENNKAYGIEECPGRFKIINKYGIDCYSDKVIFIK